MSTLPFPTSRMGRGLLVGHASWAGGDVVVGVCHLESFVGRAEDAEVRRERKKQLKLATAELEERCGAGAVARRAGTALHGAFNTLRRNSSPD